MVWIRDVVVIIFIYRGLWGSVVVVVNLYLKFCLVMWGRLGMIFIYYFYG